MEAIKVYICPKCERWQKYAGSCESLCEVKTVPVEMVPKEMVGYIPPKPKTYGGTD